MPLKVSAGLSRKKGLPDYGSVGASCHVELEVDSSMLDHDLDGFHQKVRGAFIACSQAVSDELARHDSATTPSVHPELVRSNGVAVTATPLTSDRFSGNTETLTNAPTNGVSVGAVAAGTITDKQATYARQLAGKVDGLGVQSLDRLTERCFGKRLAALTSFQGSQLIDQLKAIKAGEVALPADFAGASS